MTQVLLLTGFGLVGTIVLSYALFKSAQGA